MTVLIQESYPFWLLFFLRDICVRKSRTKKLRVLYPLGAQRRDPNQYLRHHWTWPARQTSIWDFNARNNLWFHGRSGWAVAAIQQRPSKYTRITEVKNNLDCTIMVDSIDTACHVVSIWCHYLQQKKGNKFAPMCVASTFIWAPQNCYVLRISSGSDLHRHMPCIPIVWRPVVTTLLISSSLITAYPQN